MTDKNTPTIGYDRVRGEPRRKISKDAQKTGDCVDCSRCVQVCPAGIDIRDGIQLECIQCAACSDACNFVMAKLGRPKNLIGYTTEQKMLGLPTTPVAKRHRYYLLVSLIIILISIYRISGRSSFDIEVARSSAVQFESTPSGIENRVQLTIENKTQKEINISFESTKSEMKITTPLQNYRIPPNSKTQVIAFISLPHHLFKLGLAEESNKVKEKNGETKAVLLHLFGPQK
jgi:cytochrome c oxidase accessory protein FixG